MPASPPKLILLHMYNPFQEKHHVDRLSQNYSELYANSADAANIIDSSVSPGSLNSLVFVFLAY